MRFRILSAALFTLLGLAIPVQGKNLTQIEQVLSLKQAVVTALKNNPGLAQQVNAVETAGVIVSQQQTNLYPNLMLEASGSEPFDKSTADTIVGVKLSSSVNLFNGFADIAALKKAELLLEAELESLSQEEQTLVFETVSQFIQILTAQELIGVEETNLKENCKLLERIEKFYLAGKLPISDLYQQQAETKQAELDLLQAQHALSASKLSLMQTIGVPPTANYQVTSPDFEKLSLQIPAGDTGELALLALANRSDIKAQERQVEAAQQQIRQTLAGRLPQVDLFASLATAYDGLSEESNFSEQFMDENINSIVGLTFSIPLFDRFLTRNEIAKAQIEKRNEQLTLKEKQLQVGLQIAEAIQDFQKTQKQIDVVESKLTYASQALKSYEERYQVGASTLVELVRARTQYMTAAFDRIQAKYDLVTQKVSVAYYLGDLDQMFMALSVEKN
ncbi:MAG: TolC family protein [Proteobacteria bacterium]|nr:TolC family protein [Pseudomonadota bacterium]MBU1059845.1 TolC family protein [Pseudomonadota bacterium]